MEAATPEQRHSSIADFGAPLGDGVAVGEGDAYGDIAGYSILEADSQQAALRILDGHPHFHMPDGLIEVHELLPTPSA